MALLEPPNVKGWPEGRDWITTSSLRRASVSLKARILSVTWGMYPWPPKPGFTDMSSTCSTSSST